jgi:hypothetical protein
MTSHGGPVQNDPKVYLVFWDWTSDPKGEAPYLERFLSAVGGTPWLSAVSQYNAFEHGGMLAGVFSDPSPIPPHVTAGDVQAEALNAARHFGISSSVNVQVVVATPTGNYPLGFGTRTADFPEGWCAYHSTFSDGYASMPYTLLPYMTDAIAIGADCGQNSVNGSAGLLDGVSLAEGHEVAMMPGTSPAITSTLDAGGDGDGHEFMVAFEGINGDLYTFGKNSPAADTGYAMAQASSPSITELFNGQYEIVFEANSTLLWAVGANSSGAMGYGMARYTSPAITTLPNGTLEVAFQANTSSLWTVGSYNQARNLGLAVGTSPSIAW